MSCHWSSTLIIHVHSDGSQRAGFSLKHCRPARKHGESAPSWRVGAGANRWDTIHVTPAAHRRNAYCGRAGMTSHPISTTTMEATTAVRETDAVCTDIVQAIADHTEMDPLEMTPLATVIDTDALDSLVRTGADVRVTFQYGDHAVRVRGERSRHGRRRRVRLPVSGCEPMTAGDGLPNADGWIRGDLRGTHRRPAHGRDNRRPTERPRLGPVGPGPVDRPMNRHSRRSPRDGPTVRRRRRPAT